MSDNCGESRYATSSPKNSKLRSMALAGLGSNGAFVSSSDASVASALTVLTHELHRRAVSITFNYMFLSEDSGVTWRQA